VACTRFIQLNARKIFELLLSGEERLFLFYIAEVLMICLRTTGQTGAFASALKHIPSDLFHFQRMALVMLSVDMLTVSIVEQYVIV
jgi:hypothetical protein